MRFGLSDGADMAEAAAVAPSDPKNSRLLSIKSLPDQSIHTY